MKKMSKKWWLITVGGIFLAIGFGLVLTSSWFLSLGFIPAKIRNNFTLNATVMPASDDSRNLFLTVNPGFRAEFGDKENPTSAFLRFEVMKNQSQVTANADVNKNLLDTLAPNREVFQDYQPGIEWQLFSVGIDENQIFQETKLAENEEISRIAKEILGQSLVATAETDIQKVLSDKKNIKTETKTKRFQDYDVVENLAVASDVDLQYLIVPGIGITQEILIGDRENFDTACFKLLSLTGSTSSCDLPSNRFGFLLQLDPGQKLIHSPLTFDEGNRGTDYIVDKNNKFLMRLVNPHLIDADGKTSQKVNFEIRKGQIDEQETENYYIINMIVDLNWLLDKERVFPVKLASGLMIDKGDLFEGENLKP